MIKKIAFSTAAMAAVLTAAPAPALASYHAPYESRYRNDDRAAARDHRAYEARRCTGTTGTLLGAVAGGLLGRHIGARNGARATGTIVGGAAGALAGRAADKHLCRRR